MQSLCCQAEQLSQQIISLCVSSSSSYWPHMHRMISLSSSCSSGSLAFDFLPLDFLVGMSSSMSRPLVYWPLVARPERRGSSVREIVSLRKHMDQRASRGVLLRWDRRDCIPVMANNLSSAEGRLRPSLKRRQAVTILFCAPSTTT